jgi:hypothetical protein
MFSPLRQDFFRWLEAGNEVAVKFPKRPGGGLQSQPIQCIIPIVE